MLITRAGAPLAHMTRDSLCECEDRLHIDAHDRSEGVEGRLLLGARRGDPGVVDEDVDRPEEPKCRLYEPGAIVRFGDVAADGHHAVLRAGERLEPLEPPCAGDDLCAGIASTVAKRAPRPLEAPVTIATRPWRRSTGTCIAAQ